MKQQEPRPAYHRRMDLKRLRTLATNPPPALPLLFEDLGAGRGYAVKAAHTGVVLISGRLEVVAAFVKGWRGCQQFNLGTSDWLESVMEKAEEKEELDTSE